MLFAAFRPQEIKKVTASDRSAAWWRRPVISFCPSDRTASNKSHHPPLVILRACDFFRSFRVFCRRPNVFDPHHGIVILSVVEGTPAMLIGRCSSQLSGHRKLKKSQPLTGAQRG